MMTVFLFVASNLASILIGWLLGRTGRNAAVVAAAVEGGDETKEGGRVRLRPLQFLGVALVVVSAVTALNGVIVSSQQQELVEDQKSFTECVTGQFNLLLDALEARSSSARDATEQQTAVWRKISEVWRNPTPDASKQVQDSIDKYLTLREDANIALRQNPYPEPPRNACSN